MRRTLLATIAALTLLLAPAAMAEGGHADASVNASADDGRHHDNETADHDQNETADGESAQHQARANETAARDANETAFHSRIKALRASFAENVTALIEGCHSGDPEPMGHHNNTTKAEHRSWAHCVSNGFEALRLQFHAEKKELKAEHREQVHAERQARHQSD